MASSRASPPEKDARRSASHSSLRCAGLETMFSLGKLPSMASTWQRPQRARPPQIESISTPSSRAACNTGVPHVVIPVADVTAVDLERFGAALEVHPAFPARTNVHFVQVLDPGHLVMRVWERGAGPTLACGTGACATLVVCHALGLAERRARLDLELGRFLMLIREGMMRITDQLGL